MIKFYMTDFQCGFFLKKCICYKSKNINNPNPDSKSNINQIPVSDTDGPVLTSIDPHAFLDLYSVHVWR